LYCAIGRQPQDTELRIGSLDQALVPLHRVTDRLQREVKAITALNHPHNRTLYDVGPDYLVMEYMRASRSKGRCRSTTRYATRAIACSKNY